MQGLILVVGDEPKIVTQARDYLEKAGFRVAGAGDGPMALAAARHTRPDVEDVPYVFDRFYRADRSRSRAGGGGTGLGLAIGRQLAEAHGGSLTVHSRPGQGATFTLELPLRPKSSP